MAGTNSEREGMEGSTYCCHFASKPWPESSIEIFHWDITVSGFFVWLVWFVFFLKMRLENIMESPLNRNRANNFGEYHIRCEVSLLQSGISYLLLV